MALPDVPNGDVAFACSEVECAIYAAAGGVNKDYKAKSRRLSFNIKDPRNPDLRRRVLKGEITGKIALHRRPDHCFGFCCAAAIHSFPILRSMQSALLSSVSAHGCALGYMVSLRVAFQQSMCRPCVASAAVDLVNMTPEELASDVRKSENAQIRKEALKESERGQHLKKVFYCVPIAFRNAAVGLHVSYPASKIVGPTACAKHGEVMSAETPGGDRGLHERLMLPQKDLPEHLYLSAGNHRPVPMWQVPAAQDTVLPDADAEC